MKMERITFSIPDDMKRRLDARQDINWPQVFKQGIEKRLNTLESMKAKGKL
jgi:hypothetical protein